MDWDQATEEELQDTKAPSTRRTSAKSKAVKPETSSRGKKQQEEPAKHARSPTKPDQPSPNPTKPKRVKGKQPDPSQTSTGATAPTMENLAEASLRGLGGLGYI